MRGIRLPRWAVPSTALTLHARKLIALCACSNPTHVYEARHSKPLHLPCIVGLNSAAYNRRMIGLLAAEMDYPSSQL
jgi:hypothetical protein